MPPVRGVLAIFLTLGVLAQDPPPADGLLSVVAGDSGVSPVAVTHVRDMAQRGIARLASVFGGGAERPIHIVVHADATSLPPALRQDLHAGTAGLALLGADEIHVLLDEAVREPPNDLGTVVVHELVHTLLDQHVGAAGPYVPRWVHEGLAQALSGGPYLGVQDENLLFAVGTRTAFRFSELERGFPRRDDLLRLAYAQSYSFVAYLVDRVGAADVVEAARRCSAEREFHVGLYEVTQTTQARFQEEWEDYLFYGSGALPRFLLRNCFSFVIILAVPLLTIAVLKRVRRNRWRKAQLAIEDQLRDDAANAPEPIEVEDQA
ncbi:MAG: hypothetical protein R3F56_22125 [Planctomycetota bacterium]